MSLFHEMYKVLVKSAAGAAEREPLTTKKEMRKSLLIFSLPVLVIIALALLSYWIPISPLWYIVCAVGVGMIYFVVFIMAQVSGQVRGAKYALQNPRNGETWLEIIDDGESIWTSEKFIPAPARPEHLAIETDNIFIPEREADRITWANAYNFVIVPMRLTKGDTEIMQELHKKNFPSDKRTYRKICIAGDAGKLDLSKLRQT